MTSQGESHPIDLGIGLERQERIPCHRESLQVTHLYLQHGQISQDLQVIRINSECLLVSLDGFIVIVIVTMQQAVHVPANM